MNTDPCIAGVFAVNWKTCALSQQQETETKTLLLKSLTPYLKGGPAPPATQK